MVLPGPPARRGGAYPPGWGETRSSQPGRQGAPGSRRKSRPGAWDTRARDAHASQVSGAIAYVRAPEENFTCLCYAILTHS